MNVRIVLLLPVAIGLMAAGEVLPGEWSWSRLFIEIPSLAMLSYVVWHLLNRTIPQLLRDSEKINKTLRELIEHCASRFRD